LKIKKKIFEHFFQCPYCWEEISMLLDTSVSQTYVEDCEVCCNPIELTVKFRDNELIEFSAESIEQ
jgi:transcription elongation factor Elf1